MDSKDSLADSKGVTLHEAKSLRTRFFNKEAGERVVLGEIFKTTRFTVKIKRGLVYNDLAFQNSPKV
mgnify:FL=1